MTHSATNVANRSGGRIVFTTFGSLGDLHPFLAVALALKERGQQAIIASSADYQKKVESLGLEFHALRPDWSHDPGLLDRLMDEKQGQERIVRELMKALPQTYDDNLAASQGADLVVSHPLAFTARLVAEKTGVPWASAVLVPYAFFSAYDPPVMPTAEWLSYLRFLGPIFSRAVVKGARRVSQSWCEPWHTLRKELSLPPTNDHPLFEGQHSPRLVLALFSREFAAPQPDWPPHTVVTGFPFLDDHSTGGRVTSELSHFLEKGSAPIVFTLGSAEVIAKGASDFYAESVAAVQALGQRGVLLVGKEPENRPRNLPKEVIAIEYAPYSELFSRASIIVHQGGIGTTAQAMRAGRAMLIVPHMHDQPDNAARVERLGIGRVLAHTRYNARRATRELKRLLESPEYGERAVEIGRRIEGEDALRAACDAIEAEIAKNESMKGRPSPGR